MPLFQNESLCKFLMKMRQFDLNDNEGVGRTQFYNVYYFGFALTHFETRQKATWKVPIGIKNSHDFDIQSILNFHSCFLMLHIGNIYLL